jgi:hypothetical protein
MSRYSSTPINQPLNEPRRYIVTKYPEIPLGELDYYLYTTQGDRYDILANTYYGDSQLWWVISIANPTQRQDSLIPELGTQIRVPHPSRIASILGIYEGLNRR